MKTRRPPRLATWLLVHCASGPYTDSLVGDLIEEFGRGRSGFWYWRQAGIAIFMARTRLLRMTAWSIADGVVAAFALIALGLGTLTWANVVRSNTEMPTQQVSRPTPCVGGSSNVPANALRRCES